MFLTTVGMPFRDGDTAEGADQVGWLPTTPGAHQGDVVGCLWRDDARRTPSRCGRRSGCPTISAAHPRSNLPTASIDDHGRIPVR